METIYRRACYDANNELLFLGFFESREKAEAVQDDANVAMAVIDKGHFDGFSFVKD